MGVRLLGQLGSLDAALSENRRVDDGPCVLTAIGDILELGIHHSVTRLLPGRKHFPAAPPEGASGQG